MRRRRGSVRVLVVALLVQLVLAGLLLWGAATGFRFVRDLVGAAPGLAGRPVAISTIGA